MASEKKQGLRRRAEQVEAKKEVDKRVVTGMANALRTHILMILNERACSATELSRELGVPFDKVSYEMGALKKSKLILLEAEKRVRGAVELFYRATTRACIDQSEWPAVPDAVKGDLRGTLLERLMEDAFAAISEGAYDSLEDAHMSWTPLIVDEQGWRELTELLRRALEGVIKVKEDSAERLIARDANGISCTISILGYPSAIEHRKVGPPPDAKQPATSTESPRTKSKKAATKRAKRTGEGRVSTATPKPKRKGAGS